MSSSNARILELERQNTELKEVILRLEARILELETELSRHSGNSSKPPSSDTVTQRAQQKARRAEWPKPAKRRKRQRPGKQPGAPGAFLCKVDVPNIVVRHAPKKCRGCGAGLGKGKVMGEERRQVFDLPEINVVVTEHVSERRLCRCGEVTGAAFPSEAKAPACFGPGVRALSCYLMVRQHLPVKRTAELLTDVLGVEVSTGFLAGIAAEGAQGLSEFLTEVSQQLTDTDVLHVDETGARISGVRHWFHVAANPLLTLLDCHEKRGVEATDEMGVLGNFAGVAIHDRWQPYFRYDCHHAICGSHLLRNLEAAGEVDSQRRWCDAMAELLIDAVAKTEKAKLQGKESLSAVTLNKISASYDQIVRKALRAVPKNPRNKPQRDARNLAAAFGQHKVEILRFTTDFTVPFTNNLAERDLRMIKLQQKISGCFRTARGAKAFCALRSYLQTARKQGENALHVLIQLYAGRPWMPAPVPT